jgi:hypothetical protein
MASQSLPFFKVVLLCFTAAHLGGCITLGSREESAGGDDPADGETSAETAIESSDGEFSLAGWIFGKRKEEAPKEKPKSAPDPIPRKVPVGTIHLVHDQGGFVLIALAAIPAIPDQAELMTYSAEGKPTGKLRVSPERKGNFMVADILGGHPQAGDQVVHFGMAGPDGELMSGSEMGPGIPEVLE